MLAEDCQKVPFGAPDHRVSLSVVNVKVFLPLIAVQYNVSVFRNAFSITDLSFSDRYNDETKMCAMETILM